MEHNYYLFIRDLWVIALAWIAVGSGMIGYGICYYRLMNTEASDA